VDGLKRLQSNRHIISDCSFLPRLEWRPDHGFQGTEIDPGRAREYISVVSERHHTSAIGLPATFRQPRMDVAGGRQACSN
jgi:hypothetical protein